LFTNGLSTFFLPGNSNSLIFVVWYLFILGYGIANLDLFGYLDGFSTFNFFLVLDGFSAWYINTLHNFLGTSDFNRLHNSFSTRDLDLLTNDLLIRNFLSTNDSFSARNLTLLSFILERWNLNRSHFISSTRNLNLLHNVLLARNHFLDSFISASGNLLFDINGLGNFDSNLMRDLSGTSSIFSSGIILATSWYITGGIQRNLIGGWTTWSTVVYRLTRTAAIIAG